MVLPLAACDEGSDPVVTVAGSITGTVSVDAAGAAGITVTLSSGVTVSTAATGQFTFSAVPAGAYTVTISGQPADVAFPSTAQAAVITTAGQVVTVNFPGASIRTSAIFGSVTDGAAGLAGVTVTLSGTEAKTTTTNATGQFAVAALRAGTYTVTISGMPATVTCATPSQSVTVAAGESKVASFACTSGTGPMTAMISGIMFLDENDKNNIYDGVILEDNLEAANVLITIEGPTVGVTYSVQTDATGAYSFGDLAAGTYNVKIDPADNDIPSTVTYGGLSPTLPSITLAEGQSAPGNFPFDILKQTLLAYAFTGSDADALPAVAPVTGVILDLFANEADAIADANILDSDTTDSNGEVQFSFLRADDTSPGGGQDQIVFVQVSTITVPSVPVLMALNGEDRLEIHFEPRTFTAMAPDSFDLLSTQIVLKTDAFGVSGDPLDMWVADVFRNDTTEDVRVLDQVSPFTNAAGRASFVAAAAAPLVDTFYVKLNPVQEAALGHTFSQTPAPEQSMVVGSYLRYVFTGFNNPLDTIDVGDNEVTFTTADVTAYVFHEADDTLKMTASDNFSGVGAMKVGLTWRQSGAATDSVRVPIIPDVEGVARFVNVPTGQAPYTLWSESTMPATQFSMEEDTLFNVGSAGGPGDMSGGTFDAEICPLKGGSGCATFALKYEDNTVSGTVRAADGTPAEGMQVRVLPASRTLQPRPTDTTVAVSVAGAYDVTRVLRDGDYTASILHDSVTAGEDSVWASLSFPSSIAFDSEGPDDVDAEVNFTVVRMDTQIQGVVVNDRDADLNTVDPGEGLASVTVELYRDGSGAIELDTLVATTTTDANGSYEFSKLAEGTYAVKVLPVAGSIILRKFTALGAICGHSDRAHDGDAPVGDRQQRQCAQGREQGPEPAATMGLRRQHAAERGPVALHVPVQHRHRDGTGLDDPSR